MIDGSLVRVNSDSVCNEVILGTFKKFRSTSASSADEDETFSSFVDLMKDDAKENWDDFILKAIEERGEFEKKYYGIRVCYLRFVLLKWMIFLKVFVILRVSYFA